jgi:predicted  nucleic acid-binding Zn-ribbon protein
LHEIDTALQGNPALLHTRAEMVRCEKELQTAMLALKALELDSGALDEKIQEDEGRLYAGAIHAPKEMLDVQNEVASLKKRRGSMDDDLLAAMERVEQCRADEGNCRAALAQAEARFGEDSAHLREERMRLVAAAEADLERRQALTGAIPAQDLTLYATIQMKKPNRIALALVRSGACAQCGEVASSQLVQQARTGTALVVCSNCGRILYAQ